MEFHETRLDNGLTVIAETNPTVQSVALGFFVRTGARDETPEIAGVSHFLEHMAFKGNDRYSAEDVNRIFDEIGAKYNASTSEEVTTFYAAVLPEFVPTALELLAAILYPSLREEDFQVEKQVILEEIGMYEDQPSFKAYEKAMQAHFRGHPLGQSILGTKESITALTSEQMRAYHERQYRAGNIVLAVAGRIDWTTVCQLAQRHCADWPSGRTDRPLEEPHPIGDTVVLPRPSAKQEHVMALATAPPARDDRRYAADLLAVAVGDDTGSRLYWELVDPGHAEAAELGYNEYDGAGTYLTYLSCRPQQASENLDRIGEIYAAANAEGITPEELERARNKVASRIVLRSERPMGRLGSLGNNWIYRGEYRSVQDDLNTLTSISPDDIHSLLEAYPLGQTTTVGVGPLEALSSPAA